MTEYDHRAHSPIRASNTARAGDSKTAVKGVQNICLVVQKKESIS